MIGYEEYIAKRFDNIRKSLKTFRYTGDPETIHQYRIEFKKLNAVYHLSLFCHEAMDAGKAYKRSKKLYSLTGKTRDCDIIIALLNKNNIEISKKTTDALQKKRKKTADKVCKQINDFTPAIKTYKRKILKNAPRLNKECMAEYINCLQSEMADDLKCTELEDTLHGIRMKLKQIKYIAEMEPKLVSRQILSEYITLETLIGNWHDQIMLLKFLKKKQPKDTESYTILTELNKKGFVKIQSALSKLNI